MSKASPKDAGSRTAGFLPPDLFPFRKREEGRPMNEALARAYRLAEQLAGASAIAREIVAGMSGAERQNGLDPAKTRRKDLDMFARASDEAMKFLHPGKRKENLRFARDELEAIAMHSSEEDLREQASRLVAECDAELSRKAKLKRKAKARKA